MKIQITSDQPCEIPVLGRFAAGETKLIDEDTQRLFELQFGYKVSAGNFPTWVKCETTFNEDDEDVESEAPAEDDTKEGEEV